MKSLGFDSFNVFFGVYSVLAGECEMGFFFF